MRISVKDRRRAPRIPAEITVEYRILRKADMSETNPDYIESTTINVNEYGICIYADDIVEMDDVIEMKFTVEDMEVNAICNVVWLNRSNYGRLEAGLEFEFIDDTQQYALLNFMRNYLRSVGLLK
ncbi:MAG: PilZ domain-containing protein [Bacteroidales bacterium]|jgi:c-di-GMP-binding flagellar brake protein YcgR|nr:PilZ domain-containing protein [Bacteroidales bacterium]